MASFVALNVEPEDTIEEEIDDTKEIQIEEAFKLYQNALKLHSQGPAYYKAAEEAYQDLFLSEVFKYPEVVSDYKQEQLDDVLPTGSLTAEVEALPLASGTSADTAANSLPQLVYLAYKSRAQFVLDVAHHELVNASQNRKELCQYYHSFCLRSLQDSANALECDDTDLDLWKRSARISDILATQRIVRFCLESVLAGDDGGDDSIIDLSGLDEAFASGELKQVLQLVGDALSQTTLTSSSVQPRDRLLKMLQRSNDPYPYLPKRSKELDCPGTQPTASSFSLAKITIEPQDQTRLGFGQSILEALVSYASADGTHGNPLTVRIDLRQSVDASPQNAMTSPSGNVTGTHNMQTLEDDKPHHNEAGSPVPSIKSPASFHSAQIEIDQNQSEPPQDTLAGIVEASEETGTANEPVNANGESHTQSVVRMPTRKRSSTAAGMDEHDGRTKSKRLRARESMLELATQDEDIVQDVNHYNREQLAIIEHADNIAIAYLDRMLTRLDMTLLGPVSDLRSVFWREEALSQSPTTPASQQTTDILFTDMRQAMLTWSDEKSAAVATGHGTRDFVEKSAGLALFLRHLKSEPSDVTDVTVTETEGDVLNTFTQIVNETPMTIFDAALIWLTMLMTCRNTHEKGMSSYMSESWSDELKQNVIRLALHNDTYLFQVLSENANSGSSQSIDSMPALQAITGITPEQATEFVQAILELHLDIYISDTKLYSDAANSGQLDQLDRVERWARLSSDYMQARNALQEDDANIDSLSLRFIWTSVKVAALVAGDDKSHVLVCLQDLRVLLNRLGDSTINLPNNSAVPFISISAIEQEISRLTTLDFFMSVFDSDNNDAVAIIMKLEPILETRMVEANDEFQSPADSSSEAGNQIQQLRAFLDSGDASLKLFLWRRLQNAYTAISYSPKVVSCLLRSFEIIAQELRSERHSSLESSARQIAMLQWARDADDLVSKVLNKVSEDSQAFESFDEQHLTSSIEAVVFMLRMVHAFVLLDDSVRVGQTAMTPLRPGSMKQFEKSKDRLRDMYVRLWTLLFYLLKEATVQLPKCFERPAEELAEYLRNVHHALGQRQYCKHCNKMFVKLTKTELLALKSDVDYSQDLAQILYDMYQLKFGAGIGDTDHGCTPELLRDKTTAMTLVPIIMTYARRLNMRDLIKSELKATIDKIQQCLGPIKATSALSFNRKAVSGFLKSQINPQAVYRSLNGIGDLVTKSVQGDYAKIASTGWYMLLGKMSLAKFKSIKRVNPTATDDLDTAATFLRHDLEHNIVNWETWYRLAQVFDAKIEDSLIWNAAKLNDSRGEIAALERNAVNAYSMSITMAMRSADNAPETVQKISDMFSEFAFRLYASSRPPLDMEAFKTDKHMRHISNSMDQTMSKEPFVLPFKSYAVWNFAAYLLRHRFKNNEKEWFCHYTLGKCLWKMYQSDDNARVRRPITIEEVLDAFIDAIEHCPKKEKSSDYILEPHYKLVSLVHKLVHRKLIAPSRAIEYLQATQFAKGARVTEDEEGTIEWEPYILDVLKKVGHADKSNWHHRITARAAHVTYDDDPNMAGALGARHQFTQQIFTKTMTMQVWKPEHERAGRHYVYTGRYLAFFVHLLEQLNDRENLEQLVRRIRRKTTDFLDHPKVWEQTATAYVRLMRRTADVSEGRERAVFDKISYDEFSKMSEKVEAWAHNPDTTSIYIDTISDAIELKKLNNSLMKGPAIDDLIGDTYACMYEAVVSQLPPEQAAPVVQNALPQGTFVNMTAESAPTGDDNLDRMRLNNLLSAQIDGSGGLVALPTAVLGSFGSGLQTPSRATPPVEPVRIPTPNKPGRTKTITRREIQRKAEAAVNRPQPIKTPVTGKKITIDIPSIKRNGSPSNKGQDIVDDDTNAIKNEDDANSQLPSRRPSAIDSTARNSDASDNEDEDNVEVNNEDDMSDMEGSAQNAKRQRQTTADSRNKKRETEYGDRDEREDKSDAGSDGDEEDNNEEGDEEDDDGDDEKEDEEGEGGEPESEQEDQDDTMDVDADADDAMEIQDSQDPTGDAPADE